MVKVAVVLSGCGHLDGAEIRESVLALLYLDQQGADVQVFAPDIQQKHVVNHVAGAPVDGQPRNVLEEAGRIARGDVLALSDLQVDEFDALMIPGGFGAAKNLSTLAFDGAAAQIEPEFKRVTNAFFSASKPIGAICIAPAVLACALGGKGITLTIGDDAGTAEVIESVGAVHRDCATDDIVVDKANKVVSCSAYMREDRLSDVATGIEKLVTETLLMV